MTEQKTIRGMVADIQEEVAKGNLQPPRAAELLTQLAALSGNIDEEITQRDYEYNLKLLSYLDTEKSANKAKIRAEVSEEYLAKKRTYNTKNLALELIRSLKYYLRHAEEEYRNN